MRPTQETEKGHSLSGSSDQTQFVPFEIEGHYQDGVRSRSSSARLEVHERGARLIAADIELELAPRELHLSDRIGDTPRRIEWGEAGVFITADNAGADRLQRLLPGGTLGRVAFGLESNVLLAIASLLVVGVLLGATLFWGVPAGARYLAQQIPEGLGERAAEEVLDVLDEVHLEPSELSETRQASLKSYLLSKDAYPRRIEFRKAGEEIGANAFALPGGYVVITDELVELAEQDDEVLAVYLHEVGHARGRHAETGVLQSSAWLVLLTLLTGDINGVTEVVFAVPVLLSELAFSREMEREADDYAIERLQALGLDPELLAVVLERISQPRAGCDAAEENCEEPEAEVSADSEDHSGVKWKILEYLSSHPATAERLARIRAAAAP